MQKRVLRKPDWLKIRLETSGEFSETGKIVKEYSLNTICHSGRCPNQNECWSRGTATFMILGDLCTRSCRFCATKTGRPLSPDPLEPDNLARSISLMGLKHCVITSVTRDDLPDEGASHWGDVIRKCREINPETTIEVLIPDFNNRKELLDVIIKSSPDIISHNIETVERLTSSVRSRAQYRGSLDVLRYISSSGIVTKSGFMVGLGETSDEVFQTIKDLFDSGCTVLTIGQYLKPSMENLDVQEYVTPEQFDLYKKTAYEIGFKHVESGPLVRSSYMADRAINRTLK